MLLLSLVVFFILCSAICLSREFVSLCLQSGGDSLSALLGIRREWVRSGGPRSCNEFMDTL